MSGRPAHSPGGRAPADVATPDVAGVVCDARAAQPRWAAKALRERLGVVRRFRRLLAERAEKFGGTISLPQRTGQVESMVEVLTLADACRFLERRAAKILRPRRVGGAGRALWSLKSRVEVRREPLGVVLVIGPSNYPLFLPGVQAVQALVAGNAVVLKPAPAGADVARALAELLVEAGLDRRLVGVLPHDPRAAAAAIASGVDKVVLTGSSDTGREVLARCAERLTPAAMELSGCDAVFVRHDADVGLVARSIRFGMLYNGGATCMAPRRMFVAATLGERVEIAIAEAVRNLEPVPVPPATAGRVSDLISDALARGGKLLAGRHPLDNVCFPTVIANANPSMAIMRADVMAPLLSIVRVGDDEEALAAANECPYALATSVFGRREGAIELAGRVRAGTVVVNDMIVPTGDPRVSFGGRGESGFGFTRGEEGLLEMTALKTIVSPAGRWRPHLDDRRPGDEAMFRELISAAHGRSIGSRLGAARRLVQFLMRRGSKKAADGRKERP